MYHDMGEIGWSMGFGGWFFMLLFWVVVILGIIAIVKWLAGSTRATDIPSPKTAKQILEERYAKGEIDREEFEQKKRDIDQ